ncbi:MAG: hypothetical protein H8E57_10865 [Candidatus Cloacimonetes bacterium]|nr:hypothetical protein [Candidatus Cloacimonadota bacterium]
MQITMDLKIRDLAEIILNLKKNETEDLLILLSDSDKELLKRKDDILSGNVTPLTRKEVFGV